MSDKSEAAKLHDLAKRRARYNSNDLRREQIADDLENIADDKLSELFGEEDHS